MGRAQLATLKNGKTKRAPCRLSLRHRLLASGGTSNVDDSRRETSQRPISRIGHKLRRYYPASSKLNECHYPLPLRLLDPLEITPPPGGANMMVSRESAALSRTLGIEFMQRTMVGGDCPYAHTSYASPVLCSPGLPPRRRRSESSQLSVFWALKRVKIDHYTREKNNRTSVACIRREHPKSDSLHTERNTPCQSKSSRKHKTV